MTWIAPDGERFEKLDKDIIACYFSEDDYEDYLDEMDPEVPVLDSYYGAGYILKRLSYGTFKLRYYDELEYYLEAPEDLGFEEVGSKSVRSSRSPAGKRGKPASRSVPAKPRKKAPAKRPSARRR